MDVCGDSKALLFQITAICISRGAGILSVEPVCTVESKCIRARSIQPLVPATRIPTLTGLLVVTLKEQAEARVQHA